MKANQIISIIVLIILIVAMILLVAGESLLGKFLLIAVLSCMVIKGLWKIILKIFQ